MYETALVTLLQLKVIGCGGVSPLAGVPPAFAALKDWIACYPTDLVVHVDGERVRPQEGGFYGGWVPDAVAGPVKGAPGSLGW